MKLMTKAIENAVAKAPIYSTDGKKEKKVIAKFFFGAYTWYVSEGNKMNNGDYEFFGIVEYLGEREYGYFYLSQLQEIKHWGYPCVERDRYFKPIIITDRDDKNLA